jgi:hypothetical protein
VSPYSIMFCLIFLLEKLILYISHGRVQTLHIYMYVCVCVCVCKNTPNVKDTIF